jgi:hypothetical protein
MSVRVNRAQMAAFELFTSDDLDQPVQVSPCRRCDTWHLEAEPIGRRLHVREWHDKDCAHLRSLLEEDRADAALG